MRQIEARVLDLNRHAAALTGQAADLADIAACIARAHRDIRG
ncbi:hypothetical protein NX862_05255 [Rhodobacter sp. KR11]|nr:hypothetical protein [Rhodobacter sp. KR11]MCW1918155.1 hypothetical protein [Rhodobacter sp. KR11]